MELDASDHVCVIRDGCARCAGTNSNGEIVPQTVPSGSPWFMDFPAVESAFIRQPASAQNRHVRKTLRVRTGLHSTCMIYEKFSSTSGSSDIVCQGNVGPDAKMQLEYPSEPFGSIDPTVVDVATGFACAAHDQSQITCAGAYTMNVLGQPTPHSMSIGNLGDVKELSVGEKIVCALFDAGGFGCAGAGEALGDKTPIPQKYEFPSNTPTTSDPGWGGYAWTDVTKIATGDKFACALRDGKGVFCFGSDDPAQDVFGGASSNVPVQPDDAPPSADNLSCYGRACCASAGRAVTCWGLAGEWNGGNRIKSTVTLPADIRDIATGRPFACAILTNDELWCWGKFIGSEEDIGIPLADTPSMVLGSRETKMGCQIMAAAARDTAGSAGGGGAPGSSPIAPSPASSQDTTAWIFTITAAILSAIAFAIAIRSSLRRRRPNRRV